MPHTVLPCLSEKSKTKQKRNQLSQFCSCQGQNIWPQSASWWSLVCWRSWIWPPRVQPCSPPRPKKLSTKLEPGKNLSVLSLQIKIFPPVVTFCCWYLNYNTYILESLTENFLVSTNSFFIGGIFWLLSWAPKRQDMIGNVEYWHPHPGKRVLWYFYLQWRICGGQVWPWPLSRPTCLQAPEWECSASLF